MTINPTIVPGTEKIRVFKDKNEIICFFCHPRVLRTANSNYLSSTSYQIL
jgi:hypothetical protein